MNKPVCERPRPLCQETKCCTESCLRSEMKGGHTATCPQCQKEVPMSSMESKPGGGSFVCLTCRGK